MNESSCVYILKKKRGILERKEKNNLRNSFIDLCSRTENNLSLGSNRVNNKYKKRTVQFSRGKKR